MIWKSAVQCCVSMNNGRGVGCVQSLPVDRSWQQSAYMPHATGSIECILLWQRQLKRTFAETVSQLLLCIIGYTAGTRVSSVACSLFRLY